MQSMERFHPEQGQTTDHESLIKPSGPHLESIMFLFLFLFQETPKIIFQNKGVNRQSGSRIPGRGTSRAPERRGGDPGTAQNGLRGPSVLTVLGGRGSSVHKSLRHLLSRCLIRVTNSLRYSASVLK